MRFRKLRIAWSAFWGIATVLLIALWVRSYRWHDTVILQQPSSIWSAGWTKGELFLVTGLMPVTTLRRELSFQHEKPDYEHESKYSRLGFQLTTLQGGFVLSVRFWLAAIASTACAVSS